MVYNILKLNKNRGEYRTMSTTHFKPLHIRQDKKTATDKVLTLCGRNMDRGRTVGQMKTIEKTISRGCKFCLSISAERVAEALGV